MSSGSSVNTVLAEYLAGRITAEQQIAHKLERLRIAVGIAAERLGECALDLACIGRPALGVALILLSFGAGAAHKLRGSEATALLGEKTAGVGSALCSTRPPASAARSSARISCSACLSCLATSGRAK